MGYDSVPKGKSRVASALNMKRYTESKEEEQQEVESHANVEIGNFVSELATALRFKERTSLDEGDWVEEPERLFGDGLVFGEEVKAATEDKLQITVTLDASRSMWNQNIMKYAAPTFRALDKMLRGAQAELPAGVLNYAPFVFHGIAFKLPAPFVDHYSQNEFKIKRRYRDDFGVIQTYDSTSYMTPSEGVAHALWNKAVEQGEIPGGVRAPKAEDDNCDYQTWKARLSAFRQEYDKYKMMGDDTRIAPLFAAIEQWEAANAHDATRLDIVITDGLFESAQDIAEATHIQERRNGKLTTILLNFLPVQKWSMVKLPERCLQYPVDRYNIGTSVRSAILEVVGTML